MTSDPFIAALYKIADNAEQDRAPIAQIKKGAADPRNNVLNVMRFLGNYISINDDFRLSNDVALATLFCLFPTKSNQAENSSSLGVLFKRVKFKLGKDASGSFELRINRLIDAHSDDLLNLLVSMIRYLKSQDVGNIDYDRLKSDIRFWESDDKFIQKRWAKEFWGYNKDEDEPVSDDQSSEKTEE